MQTGEQLLVFEIISLLIISLCLFLTLIIVKLLKLLKLVTIARVGMWIIFALFLLNTVGNIYAKTTFEKMFALVTAVIAILTLRLALEK